MAIPEPKARTVLMQLASMVAKLAPAAQEIDFYKSAASCTSFDGRAWRTHQVTHYFSPEERESRRPPPPPSKPAGIQGL